MEIISAKKGVIRQEEKNAPVQWPYYDLLLVHEGELSVAFDDAVVTLKNGDSLLISPGNRFSVSTLVGDSSVSVHYFNGDEYAAYPFAFITCPKLNAKLVEDLVELSLAHSDLSPAAHKLFIAPMIQSAVSLILMGELHFSMLLDREDRVEKVMAEIHSHPDITLSVAGLCSLAGVSESHLRTLFKKQTGIPLGQYLKRTVMQQAARQLTSTSLPIKQISADCGYSDTSQFYRAFSRHFHQTPLSFREKYSLTGILHPFPGE